MEGPTTRKNDMKDQTGPTRSVRIAPSAAQRLLHSRLSRACRLIGTALAALCVAMLLTGSVRGLERPIKDLTEIEHDRPNVLTGLGLVTGLNGTGGQIAPTREFFVNLMQRFGVPIDPLVRMALRNDNKLTTDSMSVVVVTAQLETTHQEGMDIDVTVASLDGATDLNNGLLVATPLLGMDRHVYAIASGRVTTGGLVAVGDAATVQKKPPDNGKRSRDGRGAHSQLL